MRDSALEKAHLLIVEEDHGVGKSMQALLARRGARVTLTEHWRPALLHLDAEDFDAAISGVSFPGISGLGLLRAVRRRAPELPVILTARPSDLRCARAALQLGATAVLARPIDPCELLRALERGLARRRELRGRGSRPTPPERVQGAEGAELDPLRGRIAGLCRARGAARLESAIALACGTTNGTPGTRERAGLLSRCATLIGRGLGLGPEVLELLAWSVPLMDIGQIRGERHCAPGRGRLSNHASKELALHTLRGAELLNGSPILTAARRVALHHHERFDGRGFPHRLRAEEIPLEARIAAVADVFEVLTSRRDGSPGWPVADALDYLWRHGGQRFDLEVVEAISAVEETLQDEREGALPPWVLPAKPPTGGSPAGPSDAGAQASTR